MRGVKKNKMRVKRILPKVSICKLCGKRRRRVTLVDDIILGNQAAHNIQKAFKAYMNRKAAAASRIQKWFRVIVRNQAATLIQKAFKAKKQAASLGGDFILAEIRQIK